MRRIKYQNINFEWRREREGGCRGLPPRKLRSGARAERPVPAHRNGTAVSVMAMMEFALRRTGNSTLKRGGDMRLIKTNATTHVPATVHGEQKAGYSPHASPQESVVCCLLIMLI